MHLEKKPKIAFVVPYPHGVAPGQRFRYEQYLNFLSDYFEIKEFHFLDEKTNKVLYLKGNFFNKAKGMAKSFLKRFIQLADIKEYDAVFIFREASLIGPPVFEWLIAKRYKKPIIFDFDDAVWLPNVSDANRFWSWLKNHNKTGKIISWSKATIAGNSYLAEYAKIYNNNTFIIPTTIDTQYHQSVQRPNHNSEKVTIGWTGSDTTIRHFKMAYPLFDELNRKYPGKLEFKLISNKPVNDAPVKISFCPWNKETEIKDLQEIDIGIMPLPNDDWSRGKCGFKGLQYMSLGIPSVMSSVGANKDIIKHKQNGFIPESNEEWIEVLSSLIENIDLRKQIGENGRITIIKKYSVESQKENYLRIIQSVL
jgi:glycosyltransferase involved in cell wall biosynthesis